MIAKCRVSVALPLVAKGMRRSGYEARYNGQSAASVPMGGRSSIVGIPSSEIQTRIEAMASSNREGDTPDKLALMSENKKTDIQALWRTDAQLLQLELARLRNIIKHNLTSGTGAEEALRSFLQKRLPSSLGVTQGQIIDSCGNISLQSDVIIYDAVRTPHIFHSSEGGTSVVPAEGVIAVIEVKSSISKADVPGVVKNMQQVKRLKKEAYFYPLSGYADAFDLYGRGPVPAWPITYSLFAYESSSEQNLAEAFDEYNGPLEVDKRIDNACFLDKGALLNMDELGFYLALPTDKTNHFVGTSADALLYWYAAASSIWLQARHYPINMLAYAQRRDR